MSMDVFAAHLFGAVSTAENALRPEFDEMGYADIYEVRDNFQDRRWNALPAIPAEAEDVEMIVGPDDVVYLGFSATMAYEKPEFTKAQMENKIRALWRWLFGDGAEDVVCEDIFQVWAE